MSRSGSLNLNTIMSHIFTPGGSPKPDKPSPGAKPPANESGGQESRTKSVERYGLFSGLILARWPIAIVVGSVCALALIYFVTNKVQEATESGLNLPPATQTDVSQRFESYITRLRDAGQGTLEVAVLEEVAVVSRTEETSFMWGLIQGGKDVAEIRVPVTYRFHVRLDEPWEVRIRDNIAHVMAPGIRPTVPPAIKTNGLERRTQSGWLSNNSKENMAELEKSLTFSITRAAYGRTHLAKDPARKTISNFVQAWILQDKVWQSHDRHVVVWFPDEESPFTEKKPVSNPVEYK